MMDFSTPPALYRLLRLAWPGGTDTRRQLAALEQSQWLSPEDFNAYQLKRLQAIVRHAYDHTVFYRELYQQHDIHPDDIKTHADFQALPTVTKEQIRANVPRMIARTVSQEDLTPNHTGGSTGEPLHFYVSDQFWWSNAANEFRVRRWHGVEEGDNWAWLWGDQRDVPDWNWKRRLKAQIMNQRFLNAFSLTEEKMLEFAHLLLRWPPKIMMGYSTTLALFAQLVQREGIHGIRPRLIEATAEKLWTPQRQLLETVFEATVIDYYSSREMGLMAYQCEYGRQHALADLRYIEVLHEGQPAEVGQLGEVAVTSFDHDAMPFIRYKNGDMAILSDEVCPCGRSFQVIQEIVGRTNDYLVTPEGQFVHSEFFAYLLRAQPEVFSYQIHQPDKDHLNVKIVCNQAVTDAWINNVRQAMQERFGAAMSIDLQIVDDIPLTPSGKHRYIISEIKPEFSRN